MKTELISIGDELLIGQVVNTNASWMAQQLNNIGLNVVQITVTSDDRENIIIALTEAAKRADVILITGGLGPTNDDITKQTLCDYFNTKLIFNEIVFKNVQNIFTLRGFKVTEVNRKQAEVPENCTVIPNPNGTAPGMWFEKEGKIYVSMPGVPFEMKPMMSDYVIPKLTQRFSADAIVHKTILTQGVGESFLAEKIKSWEDALPSHIKLAYLPQPGIVRLRLTARGNNKHKLQTEVNYHLHQLQLLIADLIYGYDEDSLEEIVGTLLKEKGQTLATAESCTGGYIAHRITSIAGSSAYFKGSVVAYANEIKEEILGVAHETLLQFGAVSEQTVTEMADHIKKQFHTDYAIATSGIAGPDGGTAEKPVGTIWIAIATPAKTIARQFHFGDERNRNIVRTAVTALNMLRKELAD